MNQTIRQTRKKPNPQGKGCVPVLQDWSVVRPPVPEPKAPGDILRDYCLSALVLAANFRFRPVPGKSYFLYCSEQEWTLSLINPEEWGRAIPGEFVAECRLQADMTWQLEFGEVCADSPVRDRLQRFIEGFSDSLRGQEALEESLPFYVSSLPYFQRMLATGLAVSLQHSIRATDPAALMATRNAVSLIENLPPP